MFGKAPSPFRLTGWAATSRRVAAQAGWERSQGDSAARAHVPVTGSASLSPRYPSADPDLVNSPLDWSREPSDGGGAPHLGLARLSQTRTTTLVEVVVTRFLLVPERS